MADIFIFGGKPAGGEETIFVHVSTSPEYKPSDTITDAAELYLRLASMTEKNNLVTGPPTGLKIKDFVLRSLNESECSVLSNLLCPNIKSVAGE
ncbi:MAG: hypothetical protein US81_C0021G0014 [Parcubacteria group bacterium GW2011_GWE2_38_18]|nr:MAG: hypothetical protein US81_C0021G0014 [Parcubacteria group bacterium GW2011_GWE2_38_18]